MQMIRCRSAAGRFRGCSTQPLERPDSDRIRGRRAGDLSWRRRAAWPTSRERPASSVGLAGGAARLRLRAPPRPRRPQVRLRGWRREEGSTSGRSTRVQARGEIHLKVERARGAALEKRRESANRNVSVKGLRIKKHRFPAAPVATCRGLRHRPITLRRTCAMAPVVGAFTLLQPLLNHRCRRPAYLFRCPCKVKNVSPLRRSCEKLNRTEKKF